MTIPNLPLRRSHASPSRQSRPLVLAALLVLSSPALSAQERPDSTRPDSIRNLDAQRVRAAYTPRVVGSAAAATLRPDSMPLGPAAPTLAEAMRQLPFVYVRQNSRGESEVSVRGSESRQAAVFFEGVPLALTWDARADLAAVPTAGVQQVDYVRGLSSLLAGPNAIGGVISLRLWEDHDPERRPARVARADFQADQFGGLRSSVTAGGALRHSAASTLQARVGGGWRDSPGIARPHAVTEPGRFDPLRLNTDARSYDAFAGLRYEHVQGRYLSVFASQMDGERGVAPELHIGAQRLWRNPSVSRRIANLSAGSGAVVSPLGIGDVEFSAGVSEGAVVINSYTDRSYSTISGRERGDDRTATLRLTFDQQLGPLFVLRGAFTDAHIRYDEMIDASGSSRYAQRLSSLATELDVRPQRFLTITAGIAQDAARTDEAGGRPPLGRQTGLGWRSGVTWAIPERGLRFHASTSERKRFPALRELYSGALNRFEPNPDLRPETALSAEAGVTAVRGLTDLQLVVFTQRIEDAVVRVTLPSNRFQRVNRDRFVSRGVELTAGTAFGPVALRGDLTLQRARIADATIDNPALRRPEDVPDYFGSLQLSAPLVGRLDAMARVRALGATRCTNPDLGSLQTQAGAQALDLGLERRWPSSRLTRALRASISVENVFDRALYDKCGLPQAGRTARFGFTVG
ncbi:MAG: TonB-dependent receptor [Gemmatimonadaceae bacterium]|nr:TonB-dependent receptor [Gemmatimonadaceae bacterium]MCW5827149.1 TonB-dependent receptor [Gemmatimonadaceae bacterium]